MLTLLFYSLYLSAKSTLRYLADKEGAAGMILWSIQKFVTDGVTQVSKKHLGVAKSHTENVLIFGVKSHKRPILKNASLPSRI